MTGSEDARPTRIGATGGTHRGRPRRRVLMVLAVLVGLLVLGAIGAYAAYWQTFLRPATSVAPGRTVTLEVATGMTTQQIGEVLASSGVVPNANMFRWRVREAGAGEDLRAGSYTLETGLGYEGAIAALRQGPAVSFVAVTVPEGWVLEQMAARFEEQANIPADEFLALAKSGAAEFAPTHPYLADAYQGSLEGFLFPKTYRVKEGSTARDVIEMMLAQFDREVASLDLTPANSRGLSLPQIVTVASIVEREAKIAKERPLVSSVIYNRLERDMRLEMCSTVDYVLPGDHFRLTYTELEVDSPYNTYKHTGLTPGPIASPGLASLKAAVEPADTEYLYYVLTGKDGSHTFARTDAEFARARAKSKEVFGE